MVMGFLLTANFQPVMSLGSSIGQTWTDGRTDTRRPSTFYAPHIGDDA